jgi:hypothetical protein
VKQKSSFVCVFFFWGGGGCRSEEWREIRVRNPSSYMMDGDRSALFFVIQCTHLFLLL